MYKVKPFLLAFGFCFLIAACSHPQKKSLIEELQLWERKEIKFPSKMQCFSLTQGSENLTFYGKYRILTFWDSVGCISCKLQLAEWNKLMKLMGKDSVQFIYCFSQIPQEVVMKELKVARFYSPVCVDLGGALNKMNDFPTDASFQTFLLDASNRVLVVGNPVRNPKVKELYERIIRGDTEYKTEQELTQAVFAKDVVSLGTFDGREEQKATIALTNVGDVALKISDVILNVIVLASLFLRKKFFRVRKLF